MDEDKYYHDKFLQLYKDVKHDYTKQGYIRAIYDVRCNPTIESIPKKYQDLIYSLLNDLEEKIEEEM